MRTEWLLLENWAKELLLPAEIHHQVLFKMKEFFSKRCGVAGEVTSGVLSLACFIWIAWREYRDCANG